MTSYFPTRPFCNKVPNAMPVPSPRRSLPTGSTRMMPPLSEQEPRDTDGCRSHDRREQPARCRELLGAADCVTASAALGDTGAEHHERTADKRTRVTRERRRSEPRGPDVGDVLGMSITRGAGAEPAAQ